MSENEVWCCTPTRKWLRKKDSIKFKDEEKANILQIQFSSVFTREIDVVKSQHYAIKSIRTFRVTKDMAKEEITATNANTSCGTR